MATSCYNESDNLRKLIPLINCVLARIEHEIIVVDDSSSDGSLKVGKGWQTLLSRKEGRVRPRVSLKVVYLKKILGLAKFSTVITIDSDLENDPRWMPELVFLNSI